MKNDYPSKVTICIPTLNRMDYLKCAIESCLSQTYDNFEIVISDNNSDDGTEQMVRSFSDYRIKYFKYDQCVPHIANFMRCVEQASGEFLTFLCDDDYLDKRYIETLVDLLHLYPTAELAQCGCKYVDAKRFVQKIDVDVAPIRNSLDLLYDNVEMHNSVTLVRNLCRTKTLKKIGGFVDLGFPTGFYSDIFTFTKVALEGNIIVGTKLPLYNFRLHDTNASVGTYSKLDEFLSHVINYKLLLTDLLLIHQCHIEKSKLDEWEMNMYVNWLLLEINPRRTNFQTLIFVKNLPYYCKLIYKYMIHSKHGQMLRYVKNKVIKYSSLTWSKIIDR